MGSHLVLSIMIRVVKIDPSHGLAVDRLLERLVVENTMKAVVFLLALTPLASYALWVSDGCEPNLPFISDMDLLPRSGLTFTPSYAISGLAGTGRIAARFLKGFGF